jgi:hypothetical protein
MFEQAVPDKSGFRKTVQEHQHRPAFGAAGAAGQGDAVRQGLQTGFDHGVALSVEPLKAPPGLNR